MNNKTNNVKGFSKSTQINYFPNLYLLSAEFPVYVVEIFIVQMKNVWTDFVMQYADFKPWREKQNQNLSLDVSIWTYCVVLLEPTV